MSQIDDRPTSGAPSNPLSAKLVELLDSIESMVDPTGRPLSHPDANLRTACRWAERQIAELRRSL